MSATVNDAMQRLRRMVNDPEHYFDEARRESEVVVRDEMSREKEARAKPRKKVRHHG